MIYPFHCDACGTDDDIIAPMREGPPKTTKCPKCGEDMHRVWKSTSVVIPDYMKATEDMHTTICNRMKHGSRPTGKAKTFY